MNDSKSRSRPLCIALLLGLSTSCGGKVDPSTPGGPANGTAGTAADSDESEPRGFAAGGGSASSSPTDPATATGQGGAPNGACSVETPPDTTIVCSLTSGPSDAVFKGCVTDSDCTLQRVQDDCAHPNTLTAYGVATSKVDVFRQCFPLPACPITPVPPGTRVETRGEDGRNNLDAGPRFNVTCEKHGAGCAALCISSIP